MDEIENLYYYRQNGDKLEKWLITLDFLGLRHLSDEVFDRCSDITHEEKAHRTHPNEECSEGFICNVRLVGDLKNGLKLYSYDVYRPKRLVGIIDALLDDDTTVIPELDNPQPTEAKTNFDQLVRTKLEEIDAMPNTDPKRKIAAMSEVVELAKIAKLNENQVSALDYYPKVQSLVTRKLVDTVKVADILKITGFFGQEGDISGLFPDGEKKGGIKLSLKPNGQQ